MALTSFNVAKGLSVGTLATDVIDQNGNIVAASLTANGNISLTGNITLTNSGNVSLGPIGNVHITGGSAGQIITTDGTGNLSFSTAAATYGDSNVTSLLSSGNVGTIIANLFVGNGANLTNINGDNVSTVASATVASTANTVTWSNVTGPVSPSGDIHVALNGNDTIGNGTVLNPYATISKAITVVGSGSKVIVHPGGYYEDVVIANLLSVTLSASDSGGGGPFTPAIYGNVTVSGNSGSIAFKGLGVRNSVTHSSSGSLYLTNMQLGTGNVVGTLTKTGAGYLSVQDCSLDLTSGANLTQVSITGSGTTLFSNAAMAALTVNNSSAQVTVIAGSTTLATTLTSGTLNVFDSFMYTLGNSGFFAVSSTSGVLNIRNSTLVNPNMTAARVNIGASTVFAYGSAFFDRANSNLGIQAGTTIDFQALRVANAVTSTTLSVSGNANVGNISTGRITLTNGAVLKDTAYDAVAFGENAGLTAQGDYSVAIGYSAGQTTQGYSAVALGVLAGQTTQGTSAVAVGYRAGGDTQGIYSVAIGPSAGEGNQGTQSVAIGLYAGQTTQGVNAIAIGANAGITSQGNNSIIINATGANLNQTTANTFTVSPVRNDTSNIAEVMFYNTTSKEVTYGNTISIAGNANVGNIGATNFVGSGASLSAIPGANVSGTVANATFATSAGTVTNNAQANITSVGTLANLTTSGFANIGGTLTITTGGANVTGDVGVSGNLTIGGNLTYINVTDLAVTDPLIYLAANNENDLFDIGINGQYTSGGTLRNSGLARDHADGVWKLYNTNTAPGTTVDFATRADFAAGAITASGNIAASNFTTAGNVQANGTVSAASVSTSGFVAIKTTSILAANVVTTSTSAIALGKFAATPGSAYQLLIKGSEITGGKYSTASVMVLTDGTGNVDYSVYGALDMNSGAGTFVISAADAGANIEVVVSSSSSNSTSWVTQVHSI